MTNRVSFLPGRDPNSNFLNRIQDPPNFLGENRIDYWNPNELRASWEINQRSPIADYEIHQDSSLAATAFFGLIKGATVDDTTGFRVEAIIGRPRAYLTPTTVAGNVNVEIYGGSIVNVNGNVLSWVDTELTIPNDASTFGYVDRDGIVVIASALPPATDIYTPLFFVTVSGGSLAAYEDLRPNSHLNYHPDNYFVLLNTPLIADFYEAEPWERVLVDGSILSVTVSLPATPDNSDRVGVFDVRGVASNTPISVFGNGNNINGGGANYTINADFGHVVFFFVEGEGWYVETISEGGTISGTQNLFPIGYKEVSVDYTVQEEDYRVWIDFDSEFTTKIVTLPTDLEFGFEFYTQSRGGNTVFISTGNIEVLSLSLAENESARFIWLDDTNFGGTGVWKAIQGLTPGTSGGGGTGTINSASNLGTGEGIFSSQLLDDLRFKSLVGGTNVTLSSDINEVTIDVSIPPATSSFPTSSEVGMTGNIALISGDPEIQVLNPMGTSRTVVLPNPATTDDYFVIINDSDGLSASGNTLVVNDGVSNLLTLDDTTGVVSINCIYTGTKWVLYK